MFLIIDRVLCFFVVDVFIEDGKKWEFVKNIDSVGIWDGLLRFRNKEFEYVFFFVL